MSFDDNDTASGRNGGSASGSGLNKSDPFFALIYGRDVSVQERALGFVHAIMCVLYFSSLSDVHVPL